MEEQWTRLGVGGNWQPQQVGSQKVKDGGGERQVGGAEEEAEEAWGLEGPRCE